MKLSDVGLFQEGRSIIMARKNKNDKPKPGGTDVTFEALDMLLEILKSERDKVQIYETKGKVFKISVHEMTEDEIAEYRAEKAAESEKKSRELSAFLSMTGVYNGPYRKLTDLPYYNRR